MFVWIYVRVYFCMQFRYERLLLIEALVLHILTVGQGTTQNINNHFFLHFQPDWLKDLWGGIEAVEEGRVVEDEGGLRHHQARGRHHVEVVQAVDQALIGNIWYWQLVDLLYASRL